MAAIFGVLRFDGAPVAGHLVRQMASRMAQRSPDGIESWADGSIAMAFGALHASLHAHKDRQPLRLDDGAVLVVDGRIDDRGALAHSLGLAQRRWRRLATPRCLDKPGCAGARTFGATCWATTRWRCGSRGARN